MKYSTRNISQNEIKHILKEDEVIPVMLDIYKGVSSGLIESPSKFSLKLSTDHGSLNYINSMPSYLPHIGSAGIKWVSVNSDNMKRNLPTVVGMIILNDPESGFPLAVMDGTYISSWRTGITAGISAYYLSNPASCELTIIGPGENNRHALGFILRKLESISTVNVIGRNYDRINKFITEFSTKYSDIYFRGMLDCSDIDNSDIIIVSTNGNKPLLDNLRVKGGACIVGVNGFMDLGTKLLDQIDLVVYDHRESAIKRLTELTNVNIEHMKSTELGEAISAGSLHSKGSRILSIPVGIAAIDIAIASYIYNNSKSNVCFDYQSIMTKN